VKGLVGLRIRGIRGKGILRTEAWDWNGGYPTATS
jgi:hypothetical protein